jgi:hypothetical protein
MVVNEGLWRRSEVAHSEEEGAYDNNPENHYRRRNGSSKPRVLPDQG